MADGWRRVQDQDRALWPDACATVTWGKTNELDVNNPDPSLRNRSIVGTTLSKDIRPNGEGGWAASIYNPQNGKTYDVTLAAKGSQNLEVEGCVLSVLCGSETWSRLPDNTASVASSPR